MFRILAPVLAIAIASAPVTVAAQTAEPAGSPRVVYHPPAPEPPARAQRPRAERARRASPTPVSHRTPTRAHGARRTHTPSGARPR